MFKYNDKDIHAGEVLIMLVLYWKFVVLYSASLNIIVWTSSVFAGQITDGELATSILKPVLM